MTSAFDIMAMWAGYGLVGVLSVLAIIAALFVLYGVLIYGRFHMIFFRKGVRSLSLASWHQSRIKKLSGDDDSDWLADDWPIGERPFYLSYRLTRDRRVFIMLGTMTGPRNNALEGEHPAARKAAS